MKARNFVLNREAKSQTLSKASVQSVLDRREPWQADINSLVDTLCFMSVIRRCFNSLSLYRSLVNAILHLPSCSVVDWISIWWIRRLY